MIAEEWRSARWKLIVAAVPVVLIFFVLSPYAEFVEDARRIPSEDPVETALRDLSDLYYLGGLFILIPLAGLLGVAAISGEVSSGSILLVLSRPVSRVRVLLAKYAVAAGTLLLAAVLGKVLLVCMAAVRGYPLGQLRVLEAVVSVFVLWLGVLFVLGTAMLVSTVFKSVLASVAACALVLLAVFTLPHVILDRIMTPTGALAGLSLRLDLITYWTPAYYYYGDPGSVAVGIGGFTAANFLVCLTAATVPLLLALWLFRREEY